MTRDQWDALVAHAREDAPDECCGYCYGREGRVQEVVRAENIRHSPYAFELGFEALRATNDLDDEGYEVAIYHSHPRSAGSHPASRVCTRSMSLFCIAA